MSIKCVFPLYVKVEILQRASVETYAVTSERHINNAVNNVYIFTQFGNGGVLAMVGNYKKEAYDRHMITMFDNVGYVIGQTKAFEKSEEYQQLYTCGEERLLKPEDVLRHLPPGEAESCLYMELTSWIGSSPLFAIQSIISQGKMAAGGVDDDTVCKLCESFEVMIKLKDDTQLVVDADDVQRLMKKSEFFFRSARDYSGDAKVIYLEDVEPNHFKHFIQFANYGKWAYMKGERGDTLQQCCRELLVLADRFICPDLAELCAKCIVLCATEATIFSDIDLIAAYYNGEDKMVLFGLLAERIKELDPKDKSTHLKRICESMPEVALGLISKFV